MNKTIEYISDIVIDAIAGIQTKGLVPSAVVVGKKEFGVIIDAMRKAPMTVSGVRDTTTICGVPVMLDHKSESRVDVILGVSFLTYRVGVKVMDER